MGKFEKRKIMIAAFITMIALIYLSRLFYLQVIDEQYKQFAEKNILQKQILFPARGLIYDRNGQIVVSNETVYDVMVLPSQVKDIDTAVFCELLDISVEEYERSLAKATNYSRYKPSIFLKKLSKKDYGRLQEQLFRYRGFFVQARADRKYPFNNAAHIFGYLGEVSQAEIEASEGYYARGEYKGVIGLESIYEEELRGQKGERYLLVDVFNREKGRYRDGALDKPSISGKNLVSSLDIDLQTYGEFLMQNKIGSAIAIDPKSGGVLAMVSSPGYDPNILTGRQRRDAFYELAQDTLKPLFNRALGAVYPPGSTFKVLMALLAQDEEVVNTQTTHYCRGGFIMRGLRVGCHAHRPAVNLNYSIETSCNAYYCQVFKDMVEKNGYANAEEGYRNWRNKVVRFGIGEKLGIDLSSEKGGNLPSTNYYDRLYGEGRWRASMIISLGIGQGEILTSALQLANLSATIANKGYYITPHFIDAVIGADSQEVKLPYDVHETGIDTGFYTPVIEGMKDVVKQGTGQYYAKSPRVDIAGKTGTAENPHGEDHSLFIAFAPADDPQIAVAVVVENAGFGSTWAAPIASLMIEQYLFGETERMWIEERMAKGDFITKMENTE